MVGLLIAFRFWPPSAPDSATDAAPAPMPASIAVLPFADLSSTADMEYFADGLAEELASSLSKVRGLRIMSRHSSFAFKGKSDDARSIGEKLRVETILEGAAFEKEGDRIRITVQLTRTKDGVSLWAETYDRQFNDVLDIQGSIAREVAATLAPVVENSQKSGQPESPDDILTHDAEAYRAYLRGMYQYNRWIDRYFRDPEPARIEFLRAVELDPQFAKAYAMLARTYEQSAMLEIGDVAQQKSLASDAMDKALKLDPAIRDWWWVKMMFDEKNAAPWTVYAAPWTVYASHLEQAIATNPTDSEPMVWLAEVYRRMARRDEALQMFERAFAADPLSPVTIWNKAWFGYVFHGDRQRLVDLTDEMERMWPNDPKVSWTRSNLALIEGRALDWDRFVARVIENRSCGLSEPRLAFLSLRKSRRVRRGRLPRENVHEAVSGRRHLCVQHRARRDALRRHRSRTKDGARGHDPQSAKPQDSACAGRIAVLHWRLRRSAPVNRASATLVRRDGRCTRPDQLRRRCCDLRLVPAQAGRDCPPRRHESSVHRAIRASGTRRNVRKLACAHGRGDGRPRSLGGSPDRAREHPLSG